MDGPWRKSHHLEFPHYPARCKGSNLAHLSAVSSLMVLDFSNGLIYLSLGHSARMMIYDMKYHYIALQFLFFSRGGRGGGVKSISISSTSRVHLHSGGSSLVPGNPASWRLARTMSWMPIWIYDDRGKRRYTQWPWCCKPKRLFCHVKTKCIQWDSNPRQRRIRPERTALDHSAMNAHEIPGFVE